MVYYPLLFGQIFVVIEISLSVWAIAAILIGSKIDFPLIIFPKYKISLSSPIAKASIGVFFSACLFGIAAVGVAFTREHYENSALKCDVFIRMCVFSFILAAGFTYLFLLVKVQSAKIDRSRRSLIEWILIVGLLGIPALIVCAVIYLPGHFRPARDGSTSVCVVNTENWGIFLAFSLSDWAFNIGFFFLFGISLRELIISQKRATGSEFAERAAKLLTVAKRNFVSCLFCVIPATIQIGMLLYTATTSSTEVAVISESLTPITVCFFIISVIYSTSKAWKFPRSMSISNDTIKTGAQNDGGTTRRISQDAFSDKNGAFIRDAAQTTNRTSVCGAPSSFAETTEADTTTSSPPAGTIPIPQTV